MKNTQIDKGTIREESGALVNANGKPCGSLLYKKTWFYFCGMEQVDSMCQHAQLRRDLFLEAYNKQWVKVNGEWVKK